METLCPQCGAEQPPGEEWKQKVCPACLMRLGLSGAIPAHPPEEAEEPEPARHDERNLPRRRLAMQWSWRWAGFLAGGLAVLALAVIAVRHFAETEPPPRVVHFELDTSNGTMLQDFAVSPDGRVLAYTAAFEDENTLWARPLDQLEAREFQGTNGAAMPFWSPDSRWIGFFADGKLKTIRIDGGPAATIAGAPAPSGGTWGPDGTILFASSGGLLRVRATGGDVVPVVSSEAAGRSLQLDSPQFLPDGSKFLFSASGPKSARQIRIGQMESGEARVLIQDVSSAVYSNGLVLFARSGFLLAQPLDIGRGELTDAPKSIAYLQSVNSGDDQGLSLSAGGAVLAYRSSRSSMMQPLLWMDRTGQVIQPVAEAGLQSGFSLSPDRTTIAITRRSMGVSASELWLLDPIRGTSMRLTFDSADAANPLWAPDGQRIAITTRVDSQTEIRWLEAKGSQPERLLRSSADVVLDSWSPESRFLAYTTSQKGKLGLWVLQLEGDRKPLALLNGDFNYRQGRFSPDGRFVAYVSDESGRDEVYLRSFPSDDVRMLVSVGGGTQPAWRRDGRELFYLAPGNELTSVAIQGSGERGPNLSVPRSLFRLPPQTSKYEVTGDGQRFLVAVPMQEHERSPIHVVLNWDSEN